MTKVHKAATRRTNSDHSASNLIVIGASAGGHSAIPKVIKSLPDDFPGAIITMLHLAPSPVFHFPRWLEQFGNLPVAVVEDGTKLYDGHVYVAPPGALVSVENMRLRLHAEMPQRRHHCIDRLFTTAAASFKNRSIGVLLTGGGTDGTGKPSSNTPRKPSREACRETR